MNVVWQISDDEVRNAWAAWTGPKRGSVRAVANQLGCRGTGSRGACLALALPSRTARSRTGRPPRMHCCRRCPCITRLARQRSCARTGTSAPRRRSSFERRD